MTKGLEFDPGFSPYIMAFQGTVEYLYMDINRFKILSQKKMKFRQYYKKILEIFNNNIGFYIGCLMWAAYIKTQKKQEILNNNCYGQTISDEENTRETDFIIKFIELFPKDMKYFLGKDFNFDKKFLSILNLYREFLIINKGFTESKYNTDILLPEGMKTLEEETFKDRIDSVIASGDLSELINCASLILPQE